MKLETYKLYTDPRETLYRTISLCRIYDKSSKNEITANYCLGIVFYVRNNKIAEYSGLYDYISYKYNIHDKLKQKYTI